MKSECDIRVMRAEMDAQLRNLRRECMDLGVRTIESELVFALYEQKIKLLDEILETKENCCYG